MIDIDILKIEKITIDVINYYKTDLNKAVNDYHRLITNDRGLDKSKLDYYTEEHHIVPKCLGGKNNKTNLTLLTYVEHVLAHMLLYIIHHDNSKLLYAFRSMIFTKDGSMFGEDLVIDLEVLSKIKYEFSLIMKENNPMKRKEVLDKRIGQKLKLSDELRKEKSTRMKENNPMKNLETVEKMRKSKAGKKQSRETRLKYSTLRSGRKMSEEQKQKISSLRKSKNIHLSNEIKSKISESMRTKYIDENSGIIFKSLTEAGKFYNVSRTTIKNWIDNFPEKGIKIIKD